MFSEASGLGANVVKSSVYFGGVKQLDQDHILQDLQFFKGELPFRYLGVPLSTKRMIIVQCKPLIDKMLGRVTSWTTRFLSYAGRSQLVKSVLFAKSSGHNFLQFLRRSYKLIEVICKRFLWNGNADASKKALIAWKKLCCPKSKEGLNFLDVSTWNKAPLGKLLWNLYKRRTNNRWPGFIIIMGNNKVWELQAKQILAGPKDFESS